MSILIRGGTVLTGEMSFRADVVCADGKIVAIGPVLEAPTGAAIVDAGGMLVMPGGIDPHTHMELPFMGTVTSEDYFSGTAAGLAGGTTMIIDFVIPNPGVSLLEGYRAWRGRAEKAAADYSFHVAVTWWSDQVREEMGVLTGKLTAEEFVRITSTNTAQIFNIYPRKGAVAVGADADLVVWDPAGRRTISARTHHQKIDFNLYEGMEVQGLARHTISHGKLVWTDGDLRAERGTGRYVDRPCHAPYFGAVAKANEAARPQGVVREPARESTP